MNNFFKRAYRLLRIYVFPLFPLGVAIYSIVNIVLYPVISNSEIHSFREGKSAHLSEDVVVIRHQKRGNDEYEVELHFKDFPHQHAPTLK
jgi:hypothetical protein